MVAHTTAVLWLQTESSEFLTTDVAEGILFVAKLCGHNGCGVPFLHHLTPRSHQQATDPYCYLDNRDARVCLRATVSLRLSLSVPVFACLLSVSLTRSLMSGSLSLSLSVFLYISV